MNPVAVLNLSCCAISTTIMLISKDVQTIKLNAVAAIVNGILLGVNV